jgi:hypothetical protein
MARTIEAFKLRTEIAIDNAKASQSLKATEKDVDKLGQRFTRLGPEIDKAFKGREAGAKFGSQFSSSATAVITGDIAALGQTLGTLIGTAIAPGIGTAVGGAAGSAVDAVFGKLSAGMMRAISSGIELNKTLEQTKVEFTTFAGSEKEAVKYLSEIKQLAIDIGKDPAFLIETSEHLYDLTDNLKLTRTLLKASADQAADFGGKAETIAAVAEALGLVAEKGDLSERELRKLFKLGIDAKKYLAEATGWSEKYIGHLMKTGRIDGAVAARLIAEGIERKKGGYAAKLADTTVSGAEGRYGALSNIRAAEGTEKATQGIGDYYRQANKLLSSEQAQKFVKFVDDTTGSLIGMVEKGANAGINLAKGLSDGITSGDSFRAVGSAVTSLGDFTEKSLKSFFDIRSPSHLIEREIGIPIGQGIGTGTVIGFKAYMDDEGKDLIADFIREYAQAAIEAMKQTGVPASVSMAQAILESGSGKSGLTKRAKNFFGIKGAGPAGSVSMRTREETRSGQSYYVNAPFRAYNSATESFVDHGEFLRGGRYRKSLEYAHDPKAYARSIASAGYATDRNYASKLGGIIDKYNLGRLDIAANGAAVTDTNPMPVRFAGIIGGASGNGRGAAPDVMSGAASIFGNQKQSRDLKEYTLVLGEADGAVVDMQVSLDALITDAIVPGTKRFNELVNSVEPAHRALLPLIGAEKLHADQSIALTKEYQQAARDELVKGISILDQVSGAIGQIAGMMPSQQVGKKRGLFSKILGFAAPFLSFIPGVGPILSQVAGMASNAAAGNWAGVATGLAGGLSPGGVFRGTGGGGGGAGGKAGRAAGGPGTRGRVYWTGEHGPEPFLAPDNGYFLNHRDAMSAMSGGGDSAMSGMLERLHGVLARLEGVRPHDVVRMGARGYIDAMDEDAGLIRMSSQRHRLT